MKTLWLILAVGSVIALKAQTNPPPPAITPGPPLLMTAEPSAPVAPTATNGAGLMASTNALPRERPPTEIFSDSADFNLKTHIAIYTGHVRVVDPQMKLTCDVLTAKVPESGGKIDSIVAEGNVVIDTADEQGRPIHATGNKAVYAYKVENSVTNETVELTGHPRVESPMGLLTGETVVWDRLNNKFRAFGQHMIIQPEPVKPTNAPAAEVPPPQ
jgi:lipopolysaccharide transport protein LptA